MSFVLSYRHDGEKEYIMKQLEAYKSALAGEHVLSGPVDDVKLWYLVRNLLHAKGIYDSLWSDFEYDCDGQLIYAHIGEDRYAISAQITTTIVITDIHPISAIGAEKG